MSTKPGDTTCPEASSSRSPSSCSPMSLTTPSVTATSATRAGAPVPSTTLPPRITRSALITRSCVRCFDEPRAARRELTRASGIGEPHVMSDLPATMPAAVIHGIRDADVVDHPVPEVGPDDVLVEVSHCGICGSDLHYLLEW